MSIPPRRESNFLKNCFRRWPAKRIPISSSGIWSDAFFALGATFRIPRFPTVSRFFRVGNVSQCGSKPWGNGPKLEGLAWRHFHHFRRLGWLGWLFPNSMHCTRFRKQSHLGASGENTQKQEKSRRQGFKGFKGFIGLNTSRKSWKSSSWWGTFRTKHSTFGLFIRLGELNDDHDLQYSGNKIHLWTFMNLKKWYKMHENPHQKFLDVRQSPPRASHHERTCDARHADLHIAITQCCPNQLTFVQLLASSWNETLANGDCHFNWVQLGHPMPKRWWRSSSSVILWSKLAKAPPAVV